jgi:hypothetical protein
MTDMNHPYIRDNQTNMIMGMKTDGICCNYTPYCGEIDTDVGLKFSVMKKPSLWKRFWLKFFLGWTYIPKSN